MMKNLILIVAAALLVCVSAQTALQITIPANANFSWSPPGVPCTSYNVGILLSYRSTGTIKFQTFDNLFSTCYPATVPQPYPALSTSSSILSCCQSSGNKYVLQLAGFIDNPNICVSFVNLQGAPVTVTYEFTFICKVS